MNHALLFSLSLLLCVPACCKKQQPVVTKTETQETVVQTEQVPADTTVKTPAKF